MTGVVTPVFFASPFWNPKVSRGFHSSDRMHVKDLEDLVEVGGDGLFVAICVEPSRGHIPFILLD